MEEYYEYMNNIKVSDTLHRRLLNLEAPSKRAPAWRKYGAAAAALVLVLGIGAWGLGWGGWGAVMENFKPDANAKPDFLYMGYPKIADAAQPDIALEEPGDEVPPGEPALGGYEVISGSGETAIAAYYILPYIEYGDTGGVEMCLDWDVPKGAARRDLTWDECVALMGGEDAVNTHLDWGMYALTGWAAWYEDGSFWGAYINGLLPNYDGPTSRFEFAVTAGQLPPTCIVYPGSVTQEIRGLTVTADKYDGEHGCDRRISFMKDDYGYRFDLTSINAEKAEERVSRLVCRVADKGLALDTLTSDGAVLAHPWEAGPGYSVGEPNWEDSVPDSDSGCPYCADGTAHTHPYNPQEAADPSYHAPS